MDKLREFLCKALNFLNGEQWSVQSREFAIIAGNGNFILVESNDRVGFVDLVLEDLVFKKKVMELYASFKF